MRAPLALLALALGPAVEAWAACDAPYDSGALLTDLTMVETAIRKNDGSTARQVADKMEAGFGCMSEPMPYMVVARAYRAVGAGKVIGGDEARGKEWFLTAIQLDPGFEYGLEDMTADSAARYAFEGQREAAEIAPTQLEGRTFATGTTYYLDGSLLGAPRATLGRPHVFQVKSESGVTSHVITGNGFPEATLAAPVVVAAAVVPEPGGKKPKPAPEPRPEPEPKVKPEPEPEPTASTREPKPEKEPKARDPREEVDGGGFYERKRPPEKTPLMIAGGAAILGAGGLYYWSSVTRKNFNEAESTEDVDKYKGMTNSLVIASGIVLGVGAGVLTWGIILDDSGRPLPGVTIRF